MHTRESSVVKREKFIFVGGSHGRIKEAMDSCFIFNISLVVCAINQQNPNEGRKSIFSASLASFSAKSIAQLRRLVLIFFMLLIKFS